MENIELETQLSEQREQLEKTLAQINQQSEEIRLSVEKTEEPEETEVREMVALGHQLLEFQERFEEIIIQLDNVIKIKRDEQEKNKNILDDIKRSKRFKYFFLSNFKGISVFCMFLAKLFVGCTTRIDLSIFLLKVIAYMVIILTIEFTKKKDFNQMLLARFIPEYISFTNDSLAIDKEIDEILEHRRECERLIELIEKEKPTIKKYEVLLECIELNTGLKKCLDRIEACIKYAKAKIAQQSMEQSSSEFVEEPQEPVENDYVTSEPPKILTIGTMPKPNGNA